MGIREACLVRDFIGSSVNENPSKNSTPPKSLENVLTGKALASTIIPIISEPTIMTSVMDSPTAADQSVELPNELNIPLPASSSCSEDEGDSQKRISVDHPVQDHGSISTSATEKYKEESHPLSSTPSKGESTAGTVNPITAKTPPFSLDELARLIGLEQHENCRWHSIRKSVEDLSFAFALDRRLIRSSSVAFRILVDRFRANDHAGFSTAYQTSQSLADSCNTTRQPVQTSSQHGENNERNAETFDEPSYSWLQRLSPGYRKGILGLILKIRTEPTFMAEHISSLPPSDFAALTTSYQRFNLGDSVFQNHSHGKVRQVPKDSNFTASVDSIRSFNRNDPYFLLLYGLFDDSSKLGTHEYSLRVDMWSTVCAKILEDGKRGSDEFAITTMDAFSGFQEWKLKSKMEIFLMKILHEGAFLLDPPQPADFKQPVEIQNAQAAVAVAHFFDKSLKNLFELLTNGPIQKSVPETALNFAHAVLSKLKEPRIRLRTKTLITSRWYFTSFISTILVYPESHGIMMKHHIGESARGTILKELANRLQKQVTDVILPWNHMTVINPEIQARINQFLNVFEPHSREARISHVRDDDEKVHSGQLCLSANDILCIIDFLRPDLASLSTSAKAGETPSTASSVAGSSTLTSGSVGVDSAIASSIAPSTSGTSMTSSTFIGEGSFNDAQIKADESPTSPLETFDSKSSTARFKEGYEIHLEEIYHGVKELVAVRKDYGSNQSVNDWAFIYIFNDDKKVSLSRANMIELSSSKVACSTDELSIPSKNDKSGSDALKEAVLRIMADYDTFHSLNLEIEACSDNASTLKRLFEIALSHCQANLDFENSLFWWKNIQLLHRFSSTLRIDEFDIFLREIERDLRLKLKNQSKAVEQNIEWHHSLNTIQQRQIRSLQVLGNQQRALRVKMWYVSDVRNSATYESASYVTRALRAMANSSHTKKPGGLSNWGRHRFRNSFGQDKSESQTLEAMTAHRDHGGLSKLADEQVEMTTRWLTKNSVENFCKGEERIHRFCFEVQKCVNKLAGLTLLDSPVLWASRLFEREKLLFDTRGSRSTSYDLHHKSSSTTPEPWSSSKSAPSQPPMSINCLSSDPFVFKPGYLSNHLSGNWNHPKGLDISNSIGSTAQSRLDFSSSVTLPLYPQPSLQSFTTFGYSKPNSVISEEMNTAKRRFSQEVKKTLCSLLISDLGYLMWAQGSETDGWINLEPVDWEIQASGSRAAPQSNVERSNTTEAFVVSKKELDAKQGLEGPRSAPPDYLVSSTIQGLQSSEILSHDSHSPFPYKEAYKVLLDRLSYSSDPFTKLQSLAELESLISDSMLDDVSRQHKLLAAHDRTKFPYSGASSAGNHLINIPRTKATSLEEVIANCTERRAGTMKLQVPMNNSSVTSRLDVPDLSLPSSDSTVSTLLAILRDPFLRPPTLFRDLQFIAAFIPPDILDQTSQGKAFWDAGLAALALKEDLSSSMIERATQIAAYHISPSTRNPEPSLAHTTLRDAARLWLTIAKEGSPIAARELGLFYLTDPKILPRVTLPLSKAKDVFRATMGGDQGNGSGGARGGDLGQTGRLDPLTFAVVFHWMEGAANGGDRDARDFLRGTGELSGGR